MPAAALAATVGLGVLLGRPLFAALTGQRAETRAATRAARRAKLDADKARAAAKKDRRENSSLKAALDLARKQEAKADAATRPPATKPKEPTLHEVPPTPPEPDKPKAKTLEELGTEKPTKRDVAERFYAYVLREVREGRSANLGSKGNPNPHVLAAQEGMGKLKPDGIYGDKTRARGKELLGKPFPARQTAAAAAKKKPAPVLLTSTAPKPPAPPPPAPKVEIGPAKIKPPPVPPKKKPAPVPARRSAVQAANDMLQHARELIGKGQGSRLGTKSAPSSFVSDAQRDMGGLVVDGIYGPGVRKRGKELTGETFPARV